MSWNYEEQIKRYIAQAVSDTGIGNNFVFEVCSEQIFVKKETLSPDTIYVVIKYLSTTNTLNAVVQPVQLLVMCEQNQIQVSQIVFGKLVATHNFEVVISGTTYVKQDYREPVVLSNFNEVSYGYRTLMYINATLFIMENVIDLTDFTIKIDSEEVQGESVKPISASLAYSMTPNTQPIPPAKIATSVKSVSTFSLTFAVPLISDYSFITTISNIMSGVTTGNTDFIVSFKLGNVSFTNVHMKLVSSQVTTAINEIPGLNIGLIK